MQSRVTHTYPVVRGGQRSATPEKGEAGNGGPKDAPSLCQCHSELEMLKAFDLHWEYGPCCGITRIERWDRADKMGLHPPQRIRELLLYHKNDVTYRESLWWNYHI